MDDRDPHLRRRSLAADLQRLASGWRPDAATLAAAPWIDNWYVDFYPGGSEICLVGEVTGHPHLGDQTVTTSPIMAVDPHLRWARTHGRFYRMGRRADILILGTAAARSAAVAVPSQED